MTRSIALTALVAALIASATEAFALTCFVSLQGTQSPPASVNTLQLDLATRFSTSPACVYGLDANPHHQRSVAPGETDFVSLAQRLAEGVTPPLRSAPFMIYASPRAATSVTESVFRAGCTELLLGAERDAPFYPHGDSGTQRPAIDRAQGSIGSSCGADRLSLRLVALASGARPAEPAVFSRNDALTLAPGQRSVMLDANSAFAVYAAPAQSPYGMLIGRLRFSTVMTPLQREFHRSAQDAHAPWFAPTWSPDGEFILARAEATSDEAVWAEMVTAANANVLWLADAPDDDTTDQGPAEVHGSAQLNPQGALVVPPEIVAAMLRARYGRSGRYLVPTLNEWALLTRKLQLCLIHEYQPPLASGPQQTPTTLPSGSLCARLANVSLPVGLPSGASVPAELCVRRNTYSLGASGVLTLSPLDPSSQGACRPLRRAPSAPDEPTPPLIASVNDPFSLPGDAQGLYLCIDNDCRSLGPSAAVTRTLWRSGLADLRYADSESAARASQGVSLLRFTVIDPERDFHPTGMVTAVVPEGVTAWRTLLHDEPEVFAYVRGRQSLSFRFSASVAAVGVMNAQDSRGLFTRDLPVVGADASSPVGSPPDAALVVLVSRAGSCPTERAGVLRARVAPSPERMLVDQTFYVFFAHTAPDGAPYECLARAAFRVRESRAIGPASWLHFGLLGDVHTVVFITAPAALGVALPVGYAHARLPFGFGVDAAGSLTAASDLDDAAISRAGAGLSLSLGWGPLGVAPRLLSVGAMLHAAAGTAPERPIASLFAGLNLSVLADLAGGR